MVWLIVMWFDSVCVLFSFFPSHALNSILSFELEGVFYLCIWWLMDMEDGKNGCRMILSTQKIPRQHDLSDL